MKTKDKKLVVFSYLYSLFRGMGIDIKGDKNKFGDYEVPSTKTFNSEPDKPLTNGVMGGLWVRGSHSQKFKLGKILSAITDYQDFEIEKFVDKWKARYTIGNVDVEITYDLYWAYNKAHSDNGEIGNSCMVGKGCYMTMYEGLGVKVAYILSDNCIQARCLLWDDLIVDTSDEIKGYDRIYFSNKNYEIALRNWCQAQGYYDIYKNPDGYTIRTKKDLCGMTFGTLPYVDTLNGVNAEGNLTNYDSSQGKLINTDGSYDYNNRVDFVLLDGYYSDYEEDDDEDFGEDIDYAYDSYRDNLLMEANNAI
jgi:hypothetical protein